MAKTVVRLTESELRKMIYNAVMPFLNEMDGKTYARIYNASQRAKQDNQNGVYQRSVNGKRIQNNDDIIIKARDLGDRAKAHWLEPFKGITFKFYGEDRMGLVADILFKFEDVTHLNKQRTILTGEVVFNGNQIDGNGIIINFNNSSVKYHKKGDKYDYRLEIDNRMKAKWEELLSQLKMSIDARKY